MAKYVNNKDLIREIAISKENDELTPHALGMLMKMAEEASKKLKYREDMDREDCISAAIEDVLKYWRGFKPEKSNNAFAYYTQLIKHGFAKGWKKLHPPRMGQQIHIGEDGGFYNF